MKELARISVTRHDGTPTSIRAIDCGTITPYGNGCVIQLVGGGEVRSTDSVAAVNTAIDALWDAYLTALTGV